MVGTFEPITVPLNVDHSGAVRVTGSRVTLDTVLGCYLGGQSPEQIAADFPALTAADVHAVVSYYLRHRPEVDAYLDGRRREANRIRTEIETGADNRSFRGRLKSRKVELEATPRAEADNG
jgi:uncharacterized protein (DUF433 family)